MRLRCRIRRVRQHRPTNQLDRAEPVSAINRHRRPDNRDVLAVVRRISLVDRDRARKDRIGDDVRQGCDELVARFAVYAVLVLVHQIARRVRDIGTNRDLIDSTLIQRNERDPVISRVELGDGGEATDRANVRRTGSKVSIVGRE